MPPAHDHLKIISGGQTGVDQAGLEAALCVGLKTGGWMPYGWQTLEGSFPEFKEKYGMVECQDVGYAARTKLNVRDSDGTLRIARNFGSPGERCTKSALVELNKPYLDISTRKMPAPQSVVEWLVRHNIRTLNVAGNSEETSPTIFALAKPFLIAVFLIWIDSHARPQQP